MSDPVTTTAVQTDRQNKFKSYTFELPQNLEMKPCTPEGLVFTVPLTTPSLVWIDLIPNPM